MREARRPIDAIRPPGRRRDAAVERLAELADHNEVVDFSIAQRPKYLLPGRRKRLRHCAKRLGHASPGFNPPAGGGCGRRRRREVGDDTGESQRCGPSTLEPTKHFSARLRCYAACRRSYLPGIGFLPEVGGKDLRWHPGSRSAPHRAERRSAWRRICGSRHPRHCPLGSPLDRFDRRRGWVAARR